MVLSKKDQIRIAAESDLETFISLVHPQRVIGSIHKEVMQWWAREEAKSHQLLLLPRDHGKSAYAAYRVAWTIVKNPAVRILYISSTANLAVKQLKFIKDILASKKVREYWPDLVNEEEGKREKWTETEIAVDHPLREAEAIRDPTVFTAGLTTGITGMHCDIAVMDDVVVKENAYTAEGRTRTTSQYSLLASIEGADAQEWIVGTRYHPKDLYNDLAEMEVDTYHPETGELNGSEPLYEVFERQVEDMGDGTGEFLWPRQQRYDGKWFGFDASVLARKRAQYLDKTQFRAQYYNNPNDIDSAAISNDLFQYYNPEFLTRVNGKWLYNGKVLNVFASIDFAFSLRKEADFSCIVVVGVDNEHNYFVLDIDRFKGNLITEYFKHILKLHQKWDFRKLRAEVTVAQEAIVKSLKEGYIKRHGLALAIEEFRPTRNEGSKEERMRAILEPRYQNMQVWHYYGGNTQVLEDELVLQNPPHDDVKDALASCIDFSVAPSYSGQGSNSRINKNFRPATRFGGVR